MISKSAAGRDWGDLMGDGERGRYAALLSGQSDGERFDCASVSGSSSGTRPWSSTTAAASPAFSSPGRT